MLTRSDAVRVAAGVYGGCLKAPRSGGRESGDDLLGTPRDWGQGVRRRAGVRHSEGCNSRLLRSRSPYPPAPFHHDGEHAVNDVISYDGCRDFGFSTR